MTVTAPSVTAPGDVTVSVATELVAGLCPLHARLARNCAPVSGAAAVKL